MVSRLSLQSELCSILGSDNVYFQPPSSMHMSYPAIRYSLSDIDLLHADNRLYRKKNRYEVVLIDEDPESIFVEQLLSLPYCSFDRQYPSDNLNHFVFTLYF